MLRVCCGAASEWATHLFETPRESLQSLVESFLVMFDDVELRLCDRCGLHADGGVRIAPGN